MIRPRAGQTEAKRRPFFVRAWPVLLLPVLLVVGSPAQEAGTGHDGAPGQFFTITEPITHDPLARVRAATRQLVDRNASAEQGTRPILVFEFLAGDSAP